MTKDLQLEAQAAQNVLLGIIFFTLAAFLRVDLPLSQT